MAAIEWTTQAWKELGARIGTQRRMYGIPQWQLASRVGVSRAHLSKIERGVKRPSIPVLVTIAERLQMDLNEFLSDLGTGALVRKPFLRAI